MKDNEGTGVNLVASIKLSEDQVKTAVVDMLLKNEEFASVVGDNEVYLTTRWLTDKWSDPNVLVYLEVFKKSSDGDQDSEAEAAQADEGE